MAPQKQTKVVTKRKKFIEVEIPMANTKVPLIGESIKDIEGKKIKFDLTRQLRGKSIEAIFEVKNENEKLIAHPIKIRLMPYFIRRMIRKRISYVEDSFNIPTQESLVKVKPFLITRKKVSKAVRRTLRNQAKNWIEDYFSQKKDSELFNEALTNKFQKSLSLKLKKTYPLSLCEIRILEIIRPLEANEIPKIKKVKKEIEQTTPKIEEGLDQMKEIEEEIKKQEIKEAEKEIKETQKKASEKETKETKTKTEKEETKKSKLKETTKKKTKKE